MIESMIMSPVARYLAVIASGFVAMTSAAPDLNALFGPSLSPRAKIYLATDTNWTQEVVQRWTLHDAPQYLGAIKVATEADVQNVVSMRQSTSHLSRI